MQVDVEPALGEKAALDADEKRQRAGGAESVDVEQSRLGGGRQSGETP